MAAACARAVELGLPSVAFTEHLDFTDPGPADPLAAAGMQRHDAGGIRPLDVPGYLAALAECRDRFPALRILSGVEAGEPHLFAASAAATWGRAGSTGCSARCTGCAPAASWCIPGGCSARIRRPR